MCDYSLESYRTRPAQNGEKYVITRFEGDSVGLASPGDCSTAVCVPSDTQLRLEGIPEALQNKFGVGPYEEVTFVHLDHGRYRDGIKFRNGAEVTLQQLEPGIAAVVIMSLERTTRKFRVASVAEAI